ncbi:hypothetical protein COPEUT_00528 [Coprococcus eutactus ATCC 27759]|nr:hypothetical protein COPEUT_00528 [Coprococcus eutactus ATCC 27759]
MRARWDRDHRAVNISNMAYAMIIEYDVYAKPGSQLT